MKLLDVLETVKWGEEHFGSVITNRQLPRRDVLKAVDKGFVQSAGMVLVCDEEGHHKEPERYREGFKLTEKGKEVLESSSQKGAEQ
jgi:hypothetical protein